MRRAPVQRVVLAGALLALLGAPLASAERPAGLTPRTLHAVADPWCPYNCVPNSAKPGLMVEALQAALEPYGYQVNYSIVPWERALAGTLEGTYDIAIAADDDEGAKLRRPAVGFPCRYGAFTRAGEAFTYTGPASLGTRRVGGTKGYFYGPAMDAYLQEQRGQGSKAMLLVGEDTLRRNILKLQHRRIDVLLENPYVLRYALQELGQPVEVSKVARLVDNTCYHALSPNKPDSAALQALLGRRLQELEADGTLSKLRAKYGIEAPTPPPR